jgi:hypothetical protein
MFDGLRADSSLVDKPDGKPLHNGLTEFGKVHCKIRLATFPSPAGMPLTKLSLGDFFYGVRSWNRRKTHSTNNVVSQDRNMGVDL